MTTIHNDVRGLVGALEGAVRVHETGVEVLDPAAVRETLIDEMIWTAVFAEGDAREAAMWLIRATAVAMGAFPASIHDLYMAAARNEYRNITTPAINVRGLTYEVAQRIFRAGQATDAKKQVLFELARSEMGYTGQRPAEYAANILAAAVKVGWQGPVMIQGDHYQANPKAYATNARGEIGAVSGLASEAINAGYLNIDIDSSTLVDLSHETLIEQQRLNYVHTAELTKAIRDAEPQGWTVSIGGEIGEVGKTNSTVADLEAFMEGYQRELATLGDGIVGISKISVQTGTSHGGVVLADGSIADVAVDFETLALLSAAAKEKGMGGAVQHGASTLPESAFGKFAEADAVEVHLATAFQNQMLDSPAMPADLRDEMYAYLAENMGDERKPEMTDAQFYYTTRKKVFGPFKRRMWELPQETRDGILVDLQPSFERIMRELRVAGNGHLVDTYITPVEVPVQAPDALRAALKA